MKLIAQELTIKKINEQKRQFEQELERIKSETENKIFNKIYFDFLKNEIETLNILASVLKK